MTLEQNFTAKDWLEKAGLKYKRHNHENRSLKGMSVHNSKGERMHKEPYCTAEGAIKLAKREIERK